MKELQFRSIRLKRESFMPIISRFFGIIIYMHWRDHPPPHFHAKYSGKEVTIDIETGIVHGTMPSRAIGMIQEWRLVHQKELMENWQLLTDNEPLKPIKPLD